MRKQIISICMAAMLSAIAASCSDSDIHNGKTPIAKVYDKYLYYEDLGELVPQGADPIDSAFTVKQYVHVWARQQLMIKKAELYLTPEQKDVEKQIEDYRNNLLIYRYKDDFIRQNLDTVVTANQMEEYHSQHPDDFLLNSPAVKVIFVKMLEVSDMVQNVRKLLDYHSEKDSLALLELCKSSVLKFDTFDNQWITIQEACKDMTETINEKHDALKSHGTISLSDGEYVYFLKIRDYLSAGSIMPIEMAEPSISRILINKRKSKLINELEQNILDNALSSKNLEYFSADEQDKE
ncbi:MAG: hypothetical protein MJZ61_03605 [Bacteroidales bacterium]|nr:hypothetical protein [Bacteroidales bacterium]